VHAAFEANAALLLCVTVSGRTAALLKMEDWAGAEATGGTAAGGRAHRALSSAALAGAAEGVALSLRAGAESDAGLIMGRNAKAECLGTEPPRAGQQPRRRSRWNGYR
jgi:hypothetical protein